MIANSTFEPSLYTSSPLFTFTVTVASVCPTGIVTVCLSDKVTTNGSVNAIPDSTFTVNVTVSVPSDTSDCGTNVTFTSFSVSFTFTVFTVVSTVIV